MESNYEAALAMLKDRISGFTVKECRYYRNEYWFQLYASGSMVFMSVDVVSEKVYSVINPLYDDLDGWLQSELVYKAP